MSILPRTICDGLISYHSSCNVILFNHILAFSYPLCYCYQIFNLYLNIYFNLTIYCSYVTLNNQFLNGI